MPVLECRRVLTPSGWLEPGWVTIDAAGGLVSVTDEAPLTVDEHIEGFVLPGLANLHSHAFQRALAGTAERASPKGHDSFWSWRAGMYALALAATPEDVEAIAAQLYVEMLEAGMTAVGEFHYLHHDRDGRQYADPAELGRRIIAAAEDVGIGLTLLPVLYRRGGFGAAPGDEQRRFIFDTVDAFLAQFDTLRAAGRGHVVGVAPHSLRAVEPADLSAIAEHLAGTGAPLPIHIAEQPREVDDCVGHLGARPVQWLLDNVEVDERWCLVHATHTDDSEQDRMAAAGLVAGLCPTTEANLGDGVFSAERYLDRGGRFGVGSDSHVTVDPAEELRVLEYGQRLFTGRRNVLAAAEQSVGDNLFRRACDGGAQALAQPTGAIEVGRRADLVVLDPAHPRLVGHGTDTVLDAWIFGASGAVRDVMVAGRWVVRNGVHHARARVAERFARAMDRLGAATTR